jgi:hypothetical protein
MDRPRRRRNAAPPAGWYLPGLAQKSVDVDCFDVIVKGSVRGNDIFHQAISAYFQ